MYVYRELYTVYTCMLNAYKMLWKAGGGHCQVVLDGQPSRWKAGACLLKQSDTWPTTSVSSGSVVSTSKLYSLKARSKSRKQEAVEPDVGGGDNLILNAMLNTIPKTAKQTRVMYTMYTDYNKWETNEHCRWLMMGNSSMYTSEPRCQCRHTENVPVINDAKP